MAPHDLAETSAAGNRQFENRRLFDLSWIESQQCQVNQFSGYHENERATWSTGTGTGTGTGASTGTDSDSNSNSNSDSHQEKPHKIRMALTSEGEEDDVLPPLDSVSAYETCGDGDGDDDSSVSTMGSVSSARRSVFAKYWTATGQSPVPVPVPSSTSGRRIQTTDVPRAGSPAPSTNAIKKELQAQMQLQLQPPTVIRRSIFGSTMAMHASFSSLPGMDRTSAKPEILDRRSSSTSDLEEPSHHHKSPLASCLRRDPHYSALSPSSSSAAIDIISSSCEGEDAADADCLAAAVDDAGSVSSSVRFDLDATDVRHFERPQEVHAQTGWSKFFH